MLEDLQPESDRMYFVINEIHKMQLTRMYLYIKDVGTKPRISKIVTLQEKEKTCLTFNESQWNLISFQVILAHFFWSNHHEIYRQYKGQEAFSNYVKK